MAVSISGTPTTGSNSGSASNPVLNVPTGAVSGDDYVVSIEYYNGPGAITAPAGFTQIATASSGPANIYTYRRAYTGTEGATFTWTPTTQRPWAGICAIVTNGVYVTANAAAQTNGFLSGGANSAGTTGSVTRTAANQLVLAFCDTQTDIGAITATITDPTGFTRSVLNDSGQGLAMSLAYKTEASSGSTNYTYGSSWSAGVNCWTAGAAVVYDNIPPVITVQPTNQSALIGQTATFSVTASGATSYQWKSLPPSGVSYTATDAFLRAAENPIASPWGTINTGFGLQISSSGVVKATSSTAECCSAWLTGSYTFGNKQSAEITVGVLNNADWPGAVVFASTTGGGRGYVIKWDNTPRLILYKMAAGAAGSSLTFTNVTVVTGDKIKIQVDASSGTSAVITWYLNGALQGTYTDSTSPYVSGQPGMYYAWSNTNSTTITGFTGLDLAATSISGATSSSYTTATLAGTNNGTLYSVDCTNTYGTTTSNTVRLLVSSNGVGTLGMFDPELRILGWF